MKISRLAGLIVILLSPFHGQAGSAPVVMQSSSLSATELGEVDGHLNDIHMYLVSEKLDGIRAHWDGKQLLTRRGNLIHAPKWFTQSFPPNIALEGELWLGRGQFQQASRIVLDDTPNHQQWRKVKFQVFDSPSIEGGFETRYQVLAKNIDMITSTNPAPHYLALIPHTKVASLDSLSKQLNQIESNGGEGVMLHHQDNRYQAGTSQRLFKLKSYQDSEATVVGYSEGQGKYQGKMGAVWVLTANNIKFKIGSGFSDEDRQSPPPLGSIIQYRYNGYTDSGIPRFARYMRMRETPES
ncbi:DNA ligase [Photobacterium sanctipauli]|uniref:DNA ligase n=2 Tax=Photobacterium sanctipauli TaxID=1342794 RepID=A0A2T3P196_9GAMM|nr:DNA ligase [Photobacterium sanctipauli]